MTLRDDLIGVVDGARQLVDDLGLRRHVVVVVTRRWSGEEPGLGTYTDTELTIDPPPKVSYPTPDVIAESGGMIQDGDRMVRKISARYTAAMLTGNPVGSSCEVWWTVDGDKYSIVGVPEERNFEWRVQLRSAARGLTR